MTTLTSLFLAPTDPQAAPARDRVIGVLNGLGIIGPATGRDTFAAADGFSRHVIFAGCSPYLIMQPPADGSRQFCHVAVHGPFERPRLVTGPNTVKPRCPACRARFDDWRERLDTWEKGTGSAHCNACGEDWSPSRLDWRSHAVSGRILIELRNVFPGEASPSDTLMRRLHEDTSTEWRHAWAGYLDAD